MVGNMWKLDSSQVMLSPGNHERLTILVGFKSDSSLFYAGQALVHIAQAQDRTLLDYKDAHLLAWGL